MGILGLAGHRRSADRPLCQPSRARLAPYMHKGHSWFKPIIAGGKAPGRLYAMRLAVIARRGFHYYGRSMISPRLRCELLICQVYAIALILGRTYTQLGRHITLTTVRKGDKLFLQWEGLQHIAADITRKRNGVILGTEVGEEYTKVRKLVKYYL